MRILAIAAIAALLSGSAIADDSPEVAAQNAPVQAKPADPTITTKNGPVTVSKSPIIKDAPLKSDYVLGNRKAPVVMVEYASLSCPHCAHFANTVLPKLEKAYIENGKLAYILRQFPLNEPAMRGAMLVECVGESSPEKYYTFNRVLFDAQPRWAFDTNFMTGLETIATVGGISKKQFQNCMNDKDREMRILQAKKTANDELKVPYTPLIYINGELYEGDKSFEGVSKVIDAKLAKAGKK